jgi:NADH-quinone oxidoreductase subunit J
MAEILFFIAAIGAVVGAIATVSLRSPFYAVLALVSHLLSLAALFLLLRAEFVAAAQVVVYAGAVMVLYVFVVAYVGGERESLAIGGPVGRGQRLLAYAFGLALVIELAIATLGTGLQAVDGEGAPFVLGFGTPAQIGALLLTRFLLPFEVASFLLLIAAVGAVTLARRRAGLPVDEVDAATPARASSPRPIGTGTMAEAVRGLPPSDRDRAAAGATAGVRPGEEAGGV